MVGIAITTAALVILIGAFNGIESMVEKLYSNYDANITIRSAEGKTFDQQKLPLQTLTDIPSVTYVSRAIEEIVVVKHEQKKANARLIGVEPMFLKITDMSNHMVDGEAMLEQNNLQLGIIGAGLLDKLEGYITDEKFNFEHVEVYFPRREAKVGNLSEPFSNAYIPLSGRFNFNKEVNQEALILPIDFVANMLEYGKDITAIYVNVDHKKNIEKVQRQLQEKLGNKWIVKTQYQKNELIYKTSKSERLIVIFILIFVFILAAFNLVASLTMLFLEKVDNIKTMKSFGADDHFVFRIFFYQGLMIAGKGIVVGLLLGYGVCALQIFGNLLQMPNSGGEAFPINLTFNDGILVLFLVGLLSTLATYFPVKMLVNRFQR